MRYWKNNFTAPIEFKFFNSWAIKNQRYSKFVKKRYPSYDVPRQSFDVPCPSYDGPPYPSYNGQGTSYDGWGPSYDGLALYHILLEVNFLTNDRCFKNKRMIIIFRQTLHIQRHSFQRTESHCSVQHWT